MIDDTRVLITACNLEEGKWMGFIYSGVCMYISENAEMRRVCVLEGRVSDHNPFHPSSLLSSSSSFLIPHF